MKRTIALFLALSSLFAVSGCRRHPDFAASEKYLADGRQRYDSGDYREAVRILDKAVDANPQSARAHLWRALACRAQARRTLHPSGSLPIAGGNMGTLIIGSYDLDKAISLDPNYAEAYFYRGEAYEDSKFYRKAVADYTQALTLSKSAAGPREIVLLASNRLESLQKRLQSGLKGFDN